MSKELLFTPITINNKTAANRIAINAMECCDADDQGNPTDKTYRRYERLFKGGAGFIDLEAITCQYENISRVNQLSILEHNAKPLEKFVSHLREINKDVIFVFQLTHSGEISHPTLSKRVRVTKEPLYGYEDAVQIGEDEVQKIMDQFVLAAKIAHDAGADGMDLKFCHGYLGSQILRPFNNHDWKYGGSWENRRQYAFDLTERIIKEVNDPDFIIGSKVSIYEGFPGGQGSGGPDTAVMDLTESIDLLQGLEERGAHYFLESAGSPSHTMALAHPDKLVPYEAYMHQYFTKVMRENLKPETAVIGSAYSAFRDGRATNFQAVAPEKNTVEFWANKNIEEGVVDMISIGRQSLADPALPSKMEAGEQKDIQWCTLCDNCTELLIRQENVGCGTYDPIYTKLVQEVRKEKGDLKAKRT